MKSLAEKPRFQRVLIRADGSSSIGLGHVVRSFVLARELHDLGVAVQVWGSSASKGKALVESFQPVQSRDLPEPFGGAAQLDEVASFNPDLLVADGYHFEKEFFEALEKQDIPYGVIDDNGETQATVPLFVVNQNPSADRSMYEDRFPESELYLGPDYALIRHEVWEVKKNGAVVPGTALVSMGGSDPLDLTVPIVEALVGDGWQVVVVLGPAFRDRAEIAEKTAGLVGVRTAAPDQMTNEMARAEVCVLAAGSTLWEANVLGKPTVAIIVADNQLAPTKRALDRGMLLGALDARNESSENELRFDLLRLLDQTPRDFHPLTRVGTYGARVLAERIVAP